MTTKDFEVKEFLYSSEKHDHEIPLKSLMIVNDFYNKKF